VNPLLVAAQEILGWLAENGFRACLIGGLAVQRWGEPRLTQDVDLTVLADYGTEDHVIEVCLSRFEPRREDAAAVALQYRVLLIRSPGGVADA